MLAGGVETALLALLDIMDRGKYDIDVLFVEDTGDFMCKLPKDVRVGALPLQKRLANEILHSKNTAVCVKNAFRKHEYILAFQMIFRKVILKDPLAKYSVPFKKVQPIAETYDVAICYHAHCPFILKYVADKVNCKKRILWIHNDFKSTNFDILPYKKQLYKYNRIYCVSHDLKDELVAIIPDLAKRISVFHNIIPVKQIQNKSNEYMPPEYNQTDMPIILSIGRLNHQKGFDIAVEVSRLLMKSGIDHIWFILGDGEERAHIEELIEEYGISENFKLLGVRQNPYPYLKNADIYVQPSRHEGYGIAVAEARALEVPIICTDFSGALEQIKTEENGIIVKCDKIQLSEAVHRLLNDRLLQRKFKNTLRTEIESINENHEVEGFLKFLD